MEPVLPEFPAGWLPLGRVFLSLPLVWVVPWGRSELLFTARISTSFSRVLETIPFPSLSVTSRISTLSPGLANRKPRSHH